MRSRLLLLSLLALPACAGGELSPSPDSTPPDLAVPSLRHDTSPPLSTLDGVRATVHHEDADEMDFARPTRASIDPVVQTTTSAAAPVLDTNFEGLGVGYPGMPYALPPDTNSAVGATQVVEIVNDTMAIWSKGGQLVWGPKPTNAIFSGFGGPCESSNDGDAKIRYDAMSGRWVAVWFSYWVAPYGLCMAVSSTSDATGAWHRYFWQFNSQTDSPMLGVWPDAYYVTINGILTADNLDVPVCAFDRTAMLAGNQATRQCFATGARGSIPVPADVTGATAPPTGEQELVVNFDRTGTSQMGAWKVHVDWATPANSTLTSVGPLALAAYTNPTGPAPQPGDQGVAPGGNDFPFGYRNLGDHESFVLADEVSVNNVNAVRWYELRLSGGNPTVYQQGTYAPGDGVHRFMPSAAIDKNGDIAIGYSVSSSTLYPGIRFTGRLASDALGQMTQGEGTIMTGTGVQAGGGRWGDYSSMSVDPVDGCELWYSQEYYLTEGQWRTRTASFHLPGCAATPPPPPSGIVNGDFETGALTPWTIAGNASIVTPGHAGTYAVTVGSTSPSTDSSIAQTFTAPSTGGTLSFWYKVTCPDTVQYDWATATLKDNTAGATTTPLAKTCTNGAGWKQVTATLTGGHSYTLTLANHDDNYAGDATYTQYDDVSIGATPPPPPPPPSGIQNGGFETGTLAPWTSTGIVGVATTAHSGAYAAVTGKIGSPTNGDSSVAQTFTAPSTGGTLSFWYEVVCPDTVSYDWATATLKDTTAGTTKTMLAKTCTNNGTWVQVSTALVAGHAYTLTLTSHDDNYAGDGTYAYFDDVAIK